MCNLMDKPFILVRAAQTYHLCAAQIIELILMTHDEQNEITCMLTSAAVTLNYLSLTRFYELSLI